MDSDDNDMWSASSSVQSEPHLDQDQTRGSKLHWEATGDFQYSNYDKKHAYKRGCRSCPESPKYGEDLSLIIRNNCVKDAVKKMEGLINNLQELSSDTTSLCIEKNTMHTQTDFTNMDAGEEQVNSLRRDVINQKNYMDSRIYDERLIECLSARRATDEEYEESSETKQTVVSHKDNSSYEVPNNRLPTNYKVNMFDGSNEDKILRSVPRIKSNVPIESTNVVRSMMMGLSECVTTLPSDQISYNTDNKQCTIISSVDSTRAVKSSRKKCSVSKVKDKKPTNGRDKKCIRRKNSNENVEKKEKIPLKANKGVKTIASLSKKLSNYILKKPNVKGSKQKGGFFKQNQVVLNNIQIEELPQNSKFFENNFTNDLPNEKLNQNEAITFFEEIVPTTNTAIPIKPMDKNITKYKLPDTCEFELWTEHRNVNNNRYNFNAHYMLPTISSRMKQGYRPLRSNTYRYPFVIGQSTNKSHNLGVNIQQLHSLLKRKSINKEKKSIAINNFSCGSTVHSNVMKGNIYYCRSIIDHDIEEKKQSDVSSPKCPSEKEMVISDRNKMTSRFISKSNNYSNYKRVLDKFLNNPYTAAGSYNYMYPSNLSKKLSVTSNIVANPGTPRNNVWDKNNYCNVESERFENMNEVLSVYSEAQKPLFNKVKTTSSFHLASILHKIKQFQVKLENTRTPPKDALYY